MSVCVVGSVNLDVMVRLERLPEPGETLLGQPLGRFPGGKGFNQAVAARRAGAPTRFCGAVGADPDGAWLRGIAQAAGIDDRHLHDVPDAPTGLAQVFALPGGGNSIVVSPGANGSLGPGIAAAAVEGAAVALVQLEISVEAAGAALSAGRRSGALTILNAAPASSAALELLGEVDVLVVNESEERSLGGVEGLLDSGAGAVVVTLGEAGARLHRPGAAATRIPAFAVDAVDTTGAGDAFCGALAAELAKGLGLETAVRRASAAGAIVATAVGAQTERLSAAAIDRLVTAA
ncbi:ribokinase [Agromyces sp. NPDC058484]|uniref:ribokinase n=1 Tax=Agromyces sp. NPDC058484 TaxID=3346524 RepID=UPI0036606502